MDEIDALVDPETGKRMPRKRRSVLDPLLQMTLVDLESRSSEFLSTSNSVRFARTSALCFCPQKCF